MRQFSDIPFASEVAELLYSREVFEALPQGHQMTPEDLVWYPPIFEVRSKCVSEAIQRSGSRQVLELAELPCNCCTLKILAIGTLKQIWVSVLSSPFCLQ